MGKVKKLKLLHRVKKGIKFANMPNSEEEGEEEGADWEIAKLDVFSLSRWSIHVSSKAGISQNSGESGDFWGKRVGGGRIGGWGQKCVKNAKNRLFEEESKFLPFIATLFLLLVNRFSHRSKEGRKGRRTIRLSVDLYVLSARRHIQRCSYRWQYSSEFLIKKQTNLSLSLKGKMKKSKQSQRVRKRPNCPSCRISKGEGNLRNHKNRFILSFVHWWFFIEDKSIAQSANRVIVEERGWGTWCKELPKMPTIDC